jgi:hypothetical protein
MIMIGSGGSEGSERERDQPDIIGAAGLRPQGAAAATTPFFVRCGKPPPRARAADDKFTPSGTGFRSVDTNQ